MARRALDEDTRKGIQREYKQALQLREEVKQSQAHLQELFVKLKDLTLKKIADKYGVSIPTVCNSVKWELDEEVSIEEFMDDVSPSTMEQPWYDENDPFSVLGDN